MKKGYTALLIAAATLFVLSVGVTVAYLISMAHPVKNTFTAGNVKITLSESTGSEYKLSPGTVQAKDPTVTVLANSENCWLFVKVQKRNGFENYCTYEMADGWQPLTGQENVFYREVSKAAENQAFSVLAGNRVLVSDNVTKEQLKLITDNPALSFTAYAVQQQGFNAPQDAFLSIKH